MTPVPIKHHASRSLVAYSMDSFPANTLISTQSIAVAINTAMRLSHAMKFLLRLARS